MEKIKIFAKENKEMIIYWGILIVGTAIAVVVDTDTYTKWIKDYITAAKYVFHELIIK